MSEIPILKTSTEIQKILVLIESALTRDYCSLLKLVKYI